MKSSASAVFRCFCSGLAVLLFPLSALSQKTEVIEGKAARELGLRLLKGKKLILSTEGETEAADFSFSLKSREGAEMEVLRDGGQTWTLLRAGQERLPVMCFAAGWSAVVSLEREGAIDVIPGTDCEFVFDHSERSLLFKLAVLVPDPAPRGRVRLALGQSLLKDCFETKPDQIEAQREGTKAWIFTAPSSGGGAIAFRVLEGSTFGISDVSIIDEDGKESVRLFNIRAGSVKDSPLRGLTPLALAKMDAPVFFQQTSAIQWMKRENGDAFLITEKEGMAALEKTLQPYTAAMRSVVSEGEKFLSSERRKAAATLAKFAVRSGIPPLPVLPVPLPAKKPGESPPVPPLPVDSELKIPFGMANSIPVCQVEVSGAGRRAFIIDTGADRTMISGEVGETIAGYNESLTTKVHDAAGEQVLKKKNGDIKIGGWEINGLEMAISGMPETDFKVDGLIGRDVLSYHPFTLDYEAGVLTFYPRAGFKPPPGAAEVPCLPPLDSDKTMLRVRVELEGAAGFDCMVDTGASEALVLSSGFYEQNRKAFDGLPQWSQPLRTPSGTVKATTVLWTSADRKAQIPLGALPERFAVSARSGNGEWNVAGSQLLRHKQATFDLKENRMWIAQAPALSLDARKAKGLDLQKLDPSGNPPLSAACEAKDYS